MGVFKNEVGRPSNKILKTRKIIYASAICLSVLLVLCIGFLITRISKNKLKAAIASNVYLYAIKPYQGVETSNNTFSFKDKAEREFGASIINKNSDNVYYKYYTYANGIQKSVGECMTLSGNSSVMYAPDTLSSSYSENRSGKIVVYNIKSCTSELKSIIINYKYNQNVNYTYPTGQFLAKTIKEDSNYIGSKLSPDNETPVKCIIGAEYGDSWVGAVFAAQEVRDNLMSLNTTKTSKLTMFKYPGANDGKSGTESYCKKKYVQQAYDYVFKYGNSAVKTRITNNSTGYNKTFINEYKFNYVTNIETKNASEYFYNDPSLKSISWPNQPTTTKAPTTNNVNSNLDVKLTADTSNSNYIGYENGVHYYKNTGNYNYFITITGVDKTYYYRVFTYTTHTAKNSTKTRANYSCIAVSKDVNNIKFTDTLDLNSTLMKNRTARIKLYADRSSCDADKNGTSGNYLKSSTKNYYSDLKYSYDKNKIITTKTTKTTTKAITNQNTTKPANTKPTITLSGSEKSESGYNGNNGKVWFYSTKGNYEYKITTKNAKDYYLKSETYYASSYEDLYSKPSSWTTTDTKICQKINSDLNNKVIGNSNGAGYLNLKAYSNYRAAKVALYTDSNCSKVVEDTTTYIKYVYGTKDDIKINITADGISNYKSGDVIKVSTTGDRTIKFNFENYSDNHYYSWYTYNNISDINNYNTSTTKAPYFNYSCRQLKGASVTLGLKNNNELKNRIGKIKVYNSKEDCENDRTENKGTSNTGIKEAIIKYQYNKLATGSSGVYTKDGWTYVREGLTSSNDYLVREISYNVGTQKAGLCMSAAYTIGAYILNPGKITNVSDAKSCQNHTSFGAVTNERITSTVDFYKEIAKKVSAGSPCIIHINYSHGQHYLTVVGYKELSYADLQNQDKTSILKYLKVIDPYPRSLGDGIVHYNTNGRYDLLKLSTADQSMTTGNILYSYYIGYWNKASDVKNP